MNINSEGKYIPNEYYYQPISESIITNCYGKNIEQAKNREFAFKLLMLMEDISQEVYLAGWLDELEYILWGIVVDPESIHDYMAIETVTLMNNLASESNSWWLWKNDGVYFVPLDDWIGNY